MMLGQFIKLLQQAAISVANIGGGFLGLVYVGTAASAPAASSNSGKFAIFTDSGWLMRSNGTIWDRVGGGPVAIDTWVNIPSAALYPEGSQAIATNGKTYRLVNNGSEWITERKRQLRETVIADRAGLPNASGYGAAQQYMSRVIYTSLEKVDYVKLVFCNWWPNGNTETLPANAATVQATIEYPIGTIAGTVTWSSSATGTMQPGDTLVSDACAISIPEGAKFAVRCFLDAPGGGAYYTDGINTASGTNDEAFAFGTTTPNLVNSVSAITSTYSGAGWRPVAVIGLTDKPVIGIIGDSKARGSLDTVDCMYGTLGEIGRSLSPHFPTINVATPSATIASFITSNYTRRKALISSYASHIVSNFGINDIIGGATAGTIITNLNTAISQFSLPFWQCTIAPYVATSSDSWTTVAGQTVHGTNTQRVSLNKQIRFGKSEATGYVEIADTVESSRDSGKWQADDVTANLYTSDGTHESPYAYKLIQKAKLFDHVIADIN